MLGGLFEINHSSLIKLDTIFYLITALIIYYTYSIILYPSYFGPLSKLPRSKNAISHYFSYLYYCIRGDPDKHLKLIQKYGPVVFLKNNLVLINTEGAQKHYMTYKFAKAPHYSLFNINGPNLFSALNKEFHISRKKLISPAFNNKALNIMEPSIYKVGSESLVNYINSNIEEDPNCIIDIYHLFHCCTLDVISELVFGKNLNTIWDKEQGSKCISALEGTQFALFKRAVFPFHSNVSLPIQAQFNNMILDNINYRRVSDEVHEDILQSMIDAKDPDTGAKLTDIEIIDECLVLLIGGVENTANTLNWTLFELTKNPEILESVYQEIIQHFPNLKEPIDYQRSKKELKLLEASILEAIRMHPSIAGTLPRQVPDEGLTVDGYYLPPKTSITIDIYTQHNDPTYWSNPRKFDLQRWLGASRDSNKSKLAGFGLGTRSCIGRDLAWAELLLVLANLIRNFEFEWVDEELEPVFKFVYRPKDKRFRLRATKRS